MRLHLKPLLILALLSFIAIPASAGEILWVHDYKAGIQVARETLKAVLVDFSALWCPPCEEMDQKVYSDRKLIEASRDYVFIHIDVDRDQESALRYGIRMVPTLIFLDPLENVLVRREQRTRARDLLRIFADLPESFLPVSDAFQLLSQNKDHADALMTLSAFYRKQGFGNLAGQLTSRARSISAVSAIRDATDASRVRIEPTAAAGGGNLF